MGFFSICRYQRSYLKISYWFRRRERACDHLNVITFNVVCSLPFLSDCHGHCLFQYLSLFYGVFSIRSLSGPLYLFSFSHCHCHCHSLYQFSIAFFQFGSLASYSQPDPKLLAELRIW